MKRKPPERKKLLVYLQPDLYTKLRSVKRLSCLSMNQQINMILREHFEPKVEEKVS